MPGKSSAAFAAQIYAEDGACADFMSLAQAEDRCKKAIDAYNSLSNEDSAKEVMLSAKHYIYCSENADPVAGAARAIHEVLDLFDKNGLSIEWGSYAFIPKDGNLSIKVPLAPLPICKNIDNILKIDPSIKITKEMQEFLHKNLQCSSEEKANLLEKTVKNMTQQNKLSQKETDLLRNILVGMQTSSITSDSAQEVASDISVNDFLKNVGDKAKAFESINKPSTDTAESYEEEKKEPEQESEQVKIIKEWMQKDAHARKEACKQQEYIDTLNQSFEMMGAISRLSGNKVCGQIASAGFIGVNIYSAVIKGGVSGMLGAFTGILNLASLFTSSQDDALSKQLGMINEQLGIIREQLHAVLTDLSIVKEQQRKTLKILVEGINQILEKVETSANRTIDATYQFMQNLDGKSNARFSLLGNKLDVILYKKIKELHHKYGTPGAVWEANDVLKDLTSTYTIAEQDAFSNAYQVNSVDRQDHDTIEKSLTVLDKNELLWLINSELIHRHLKNGALSDMGNPTVYITASDLILKTISVLPSESKFKQHDYLINILKRSKQKGQYLQRGLSSLNNKELVKKILQAYTNKATELDQALNVILREICQKENYIANEYDTSQSYIVNYSGCCLLHNVRHNGCDGLTYDPRGTGWCDHISNRHQIPVNYPTERQMQLPGVFNVVVGNNLGSVVWNPGIDNSATEDLFDIPGHMHHRYKQQILYTDNTGKRTVLAHYVWEMVNADSTLQDYIKEREGIGYGKGGAIRYYNSYHGPHRKFTDIISGVFGIHIFSINHRTTALWSSTWCNFTYNGIQRYEDRINSVVAELQEAMRAKKAASAAHLARRFKVDEFENVTVILKEMTILRLLLKRLSEYLGLGLPDLISKEQLLDSLENVIYRNLDDAAFYTQNPPALVIPWSVNQARFTDIATNIERKIFAPLSEHIRLRALNNKFSHLAKYLKESRAIRIERANSEVNYCSDDESEELKNFDQGALADIVIPRTYWDYEMAGDAKHVLGKGACASEVYAGICEGQKAAIKTFSAAAVSEDTKTGFFNEAKNFLKIKIGHKNVIKCFGITKHRNKNTRLIGYSLILERADTTLYNYLQSVKVINPMQQFSMALELARAIAFIHGKGVVHKDIKDTNILLVKADNDYYTAKIADLGISSIRNHVETTQTQSNDSAQGTLHWKDPRLLVDDETNHSQSTDMFSYALVIWKIVTCGKSFTDSSFRGFSKEAHKFLMNYCKNRRFRLPLPKNCNAVLAEVIKGAWNPDINKRMKAVDIVNFIERAAPDVVSSLNGEAKEESRSVVPN